ncbi:MAG: hypothetical protein SNI32_08750, partial [Rikenellaceae bacterium]
MRRYILYIFTLLLAASCSKSETATSADQDEVVEVAFSMMTKADSNGEETYCFALFSSSQTSMPEYGFYESTIISLTENTYSWLTPKETIIDENTTTLGLAASSGTYTMSSVSPATAPTSASIYYTSATETTSKTIYGYPYNRTPQAESDYDELYMGDPLTIYIEGALASTSSSTTTYTYTFDEDYALKQQRTKFQLKVRAGTYINESDVEIPLSYYLSSIYIADVVNSALFNPTVGYYATEVIDHLYPFSNFQDDDQGFTINWTESTALEVTDGEKVDTENVFYLLSADYSDRDKYPITPTLNVEFLSTAESTYGSVREVPIMLDIDFKPQYYYTLDLLINSIEMILTITVSDWG